MVLVLHGGLLGSFQVMADLEAVMNGDLTVDEKGNTRGKMFQKNLTAFKTKVADIISAQRNAR